MALFELSDEPGHQGLRPWPGSTDGGSVGSAEH